MARKKSDKTIHDDFCNNSRYFEDAVSDCRYGIRCGSRMVWDADTAVLFEKYKAWVLTGEFPLPQSGTHGVSHEHDEAIS